MSCCIAADILLTLIARILDEGGKTPQVFRHWEKQGTEPFPVIWGSQPNHRDQGKTGKGPIMFGGGLFLPALPRPIIYMRFLHCVSLQSEIAKPVQHADIFSTAHNRIAIFHGWRWTKENYSELLELWDSDSSFSRF